ncbi:MAG: hypothetical protein HY731_12050 [Candidatus Tectomicrobia bacterium]|nr:hypothetical protein [Candidatus Tectomicrobia bacterium]
MITQDKSFSQDYSHPLEITHHGSGDRLVEEAEQIVHEIAEIDHLTLCFLPDGTVNFYPETFDPERLYRRLKRVLKVFRQHPEALRCAVGACDGRCGHATH